MNKFQETLFRIGLLRWEILSVFGIIALVVLIWYAVLPIVSSQWKQCTSISKDISFLKTADLLPEKSNSIKSKADTIDSLLKMSENQKSFNEPVVMKKMYMLSDSTGCSISKVQIGEPISISSGIEIPVLLQGAGKYSSIGRFVDGIENSDFAARIRQLTVKNDKKGDYGSIFLDFVIMESSIRGK